MMVLKPFSDIEGGHSFHLFVLVSSNLDARNASNLLNLSLDVCGFYSWIATYCWWKTSTRTTIFWWHPTWWLMVVSHCLVSWVILDCTLWKGDFLKPAPRGHQVWLLMDEKTPVFTVLQVIYITVTIFAIVNESWQQHFFLERGWVIDGDGDGWLGEHVVDSFFLAGISRSRALETPWLECKIICNLSSQQIWKESRHTCMLVRVGLGMLEQP